MIKEKLCLYLAWILSCTITLASLYLSEIKHIEPCSLCWYERLSLFPLTIFLGVALYKSFFSVFSYVIAFPALGLIVSALHIALQEIPSFHPKVCSSAVSCAIKHSIGLGAISIPMVAFATFLILVVLLCVGKPRQGTNE